MNAASSKKLLKNLPSQEDIILMAYYLKNQDDRTIAIMGTSYLEHGLETLIRTHFQELDQDGDRRMYNGAAGGILGPFSAKIRVAYAANYIEKRIYEDLLLINDIRNVFAHSLYASIDFNNSLIKEDCDKLRWVREYYIEEKSDPPFFTCTAHVFLQSIHLISLYLSKEVLKTYVGEPPP